MTGSQKVRRTTKSNMRSLVHRTVIATLLASVVACQDVPPLYPPNAPPDIHEACAVAERKCTACHERDRIVYASHTPFEWHNTVERMRQYPGSAITRADGEVILRCLSYNADQGSR